MATQRWTDEMLDELASSVSDLKDTVERIGNEIDGMRLTAQALLQLAAQAQEADRRQNEEFLRYKQENDQRFNILLEEIRHLARRGIEE